MSATQVPLVADVLLENMERAGYVGVTQCGHMGQIYRYRSAGDPSVLAGLFGCTVEDGVIRMESIQLNLHASTHCITISTIVM